MKKDVNKPLSDFERLLMGFSIRYAIGRSSIASQSLPADILKHFYDRMTEDQRIAEAKDVEREVQLCKSFRKLPSSYDEFEVWEKFSLALNSENHCTVVATDSSEHICFKYKDEYYPLKRYIANSYVKCTIPAEYIAGVR
jgi:hypothetical protein